ncbi:MAG: FMN-binding protein [Firmicutes bacterium HGW-Firmicutes-11]|nr:MAG: FMN-binding protein [Firmicutes bacterium HGW-Firmicutes-11]
MQKLKKRRGIKKVWIVVLSIVGVVGLVTVGAIVFTAPGRAELQNMTIGAVDFENLRDGVFTGEYRGTKDGTRNAAVEVAIVSGDITAIRVTAGPLANEKQMTEIRNSHSINDLFTEVTKSQSMQVDVISGATLTSNAHLKALENALKQAEIN